MLTVIAHALLAAGGYSCALALMRAYQKLFPLVVGVGLIGLGFGVQSHVEKVPELAPQAAVLKSAAAAQGAREKA